MAESDNGKGDIELQEKDSARVQHQKARELQTTDVSKLQETKNGDQTKASGIPKKKHPLPPEKDYATEENENSDQNKASGVSKKKQPLPPEKDYATEDCDQNKLSRRSTERPEPPERDYPTEENPVQPKEVSGVSKKPATSDNPPTREHYATEKSEVAGGSGVYASVKNKRKTLGSFVPRPEFVYRPDNAEGWMSCLRIGLILFNLLIWAFGAALTGLGIWIRMDKDFWNIQTNLDMTQFENASYVLIAAGVVIMIVGFIGCYGAIASQICMLILFSIIVAIIIVLEIAVVAIVFSVTASKENQDKVKLKAIKALHEMMDDDKKRYFINLVQSKLECCGVNGPGDYSNGDKPIEIPGSCRDEDGKMREKGCYDALMDYFKEKAALCGGIAVVVFLLQLAALILTGCLICSLRQSSNGIF